MAYWHNFSQETKLLMFQVSASMNIYAMLNRLKATRKENIYLPEPVVAEVCRCYLKNKDKIKNNYAWFHRVATLKDREYRIAQTIKENDSRKREPVAPLVKSLIADCFQKRVDIFR